MNEVPLLSILTIVLLPVMLHTFPNDPTAIILPSSHLMAYIVGRSVGAWRVVREIKKHRRDYHE